MEVTFSTVSSVYFFPPMPSCCLCCESSKGDRKDKKTKWLRGITSVCVKGEANANTSLQGPH